MSDTQTDPTPAPTTMVVKPSPVQLLVTGAIISPWIISTVGPMFGLTPVATEDKLALFNLVTLVIGYYFGSSQGSATKDALLALRPGTRP